MNFSNNGQAFIKTTISAGSNTLILEDGQGELFPSAPFRITLEKFDNGKVIKREISHCTSKSGDVLTIDRAVEACPMSWDSVSPVMQAYSFDSGDVVSHNITAGSMDEINNKIIDLETNKADQTAVDALNNVYAAASGGTDTYAFTIPGFGSYASKVGKHYTFLADVANVGASNVNINGLGVIPLYKNHDVATETGDIEIGQMVEIIIGVGGTYAEIASQTAKVIDLTAVEPRALFDRQIEAGENIPDLWDVYIGDDGKIYKSDGNILAKAKSYGIAIDGPYTTGQFPKVITKGISPAQELTPGKPVYLGKRYVGVSNSSTIAQTTNVGDTHSYTVFGNASNSLPYAGQTITTVTDIILRSITISLRKTGAPTDEVMCRIYASDRTTLIYESTTLISGASMTTTYTNYVFNFDDIILQAGTVYFIELRRTGAFDTSNNYNWGRNSAGGYAGGSLWWNPSGGSGGWSAQTGEDHTFTLQMGTGTESNISHTPGIYPILIGEAQSATKIDIDKRHSWKKNVIASTNYKIEANRLKMLSTGTYTKIKEVMIGFSGTVKVTFDMHGDVANSSYDVYGVVYKNGVATAVSGQNYDLTFQTYSGDISVSEGDLIQLYIKSDAGAICSVRNFKIGYDFAYDISSRVITD